MNRALDTPDLPWYRHLWVWLVMIPPAAAVVAGFVTAWLAGAPPALVVDDYSEIAMATELQRARDQLASNLGLTARLAIDGDGDAARLRVEVNARQPDFRSPDRLQLQLIHPTHQERDQAVELGRNGAGYTGRIIRPASRVYVALSDLDGQWRLTDELPAGAARLDLEARAPP